MRFHTLRFLVFLDHLFGHRSCWFCAFVNDIEERWGDDCYIDYTFYQRDT